MQDRRGKGRYTAKERIHQTKDTMRLVFILILFTNTLFAQISFTEQEVISLDSMITWHEQNDSIKSHSILLLDKQLGLYKQQTTLDSTLLFYKDQELELLNNRVLLYKDLSDAYKPKWYDKKVIWFLAGVVTITTSAIVLDKVQ